jgi:signal peptidase
MKKAAVSRTHHFFSPKTHQPQVEILTKGDNNRVDDRGLYAPGQLWLRREDILGRAKVRAACDPTSVY